MQPVQAQDAPIRGQLRAPVDIGGTAGAMAVPWLLEAPSVFEFPGQIAENGGAGSQAAPEGVPVATVAKRSRICQHCFTCGHKMRVGPFKDHKQFLASGRGAVCTLREDLKRVVQRPKEKNAIRKFGGECECVGDAEDPGGCKSVPSNKQS